MGFFRTVFGCCSQPKKLDKNPGACIFFFLYKPITTYSLFLIFQFIVAVKQTINLKYSKHAKQRMAERGISVAKVEEVYEKVSNRKINGLEAITTIKMDRGKQIYGLMDFNIKNALKGNTAKGVYYQVILSPENIVVTATVNELSAKQVIVITAKDNRGSLNHNVLTTSVDDNTLRKCLNYS